MNIRDKHFDPMSSNEWIHCFSNNEFSQEELFKIFKSGFALAIGKE